jgi:hypothetical protein
MQSIGIGLALEHHAVGREKGCVQLGEQLDGTERVPETRERVEVGQRADQLGFVVGVGVVAFRGVPGDSPSLLTEEALGSLLRRRVGLQAQWFFGGEHLEQERQSVAPAARAVRPEVVIRVGMHSL